MTNVVPFDELENEREIEAYQIGLPRIVLEGKDDLRLFKTYWFSHLTDSFDFVKAEDIADGGGCSAVREAVARSRLNNIPAFGFSDRDHLFKTQNWNLLFSVDDDEFRVGTSDVHFYTTLRWEIEAYLLEPDLLPAWLRSHRRPPASDAHCATALAQAVDECEHLLRASQFFATAHVVGVEVKLEYFSDKEAQQLVEASNIALGRLQGSTDVAVGVGTLVEEVLRLAPHELSARLRWLLRYVDTKRLLIRLARRFAAEREIRWPLAELMRFGNLRPVELERRLNALKQTLTNSV